MFRTTGTDSELLFLGRRGKRACNSDFLPFRVFFFACDLCMLEVHRFLGHLREEELSAIEGLCMLLQKCLGISKIIGRPNLPSPLYSSTELADIGAVLEYRRLSVNLGRRSKNKRY